MNTRTPEDQTATATFTCPACGTETETEYDGCGSYSQMFASDPMEERQVYCRNRDCREPVGTVWEY